MPGQDNRDKPEGNGRRTRRQFLGGSAAIVGAGFGGGMLRTGKPARAGEEQADGVRADAGGLAAAEAPPSTFFSTAFVEYASSYSTDSNGDLWANSWADDDNIYAANGDGSGFSTQPGADVVVNRITGTPDTGIGGERLAAGADVANVWADPASYNRKPTGMACVDGVLYLAVQDLRTPPCPPCFNDAPNASISASEDHGQTWVKTTAPMFTDYHFTTVFFLDFGKDYGNARAALGPSDGRYVYAYGLDWNWRDSYSDTVPDPVNVYLARVPRGSVQDRSRWEFFTGSARAAGRPGAATSTPRPPSCMTADGGWFSAYGGGLRVQVRQDFTWRDVAGLRIAPRYPYDNTAGPNNTYALRFHPTWGTGSASSDSRAAARSSPRSGSLPSTMAERLAAAAWRRCR